MSKRHIGAKAAAWCRETAPRVAAVLSAWLLAMPGDASAASDSIDSTPRFRFDRTDTVLSRDVRPERLQVRFELDPDAPHFSADGVLTLRVLKAVQLIELHAQQLEPGVVVLLSEDGERPLQVEPDTQRSTWRLVPADGGAIAPGRHRLRMAWRGTVQKTGTGLYVVEHGSGETRSRMLATQLQAVYARTLMPVMDEPVFRTVFELSVKAPRELEVVSNTPRLAQIPLQGDGRDWILHRFAPTPPMPSYLMALAVGRFDRVEGQAGGVPVAILTAPGKGTQASYALQATQRLLPWLADYFGQPYQLPKLDQLAVPGVRQGAMEDWGLISYYETLLLWDPVRSTAAAQRRVFSLIAHEISHQWFGNLVSPAGWNEIWLNEAFATWLERKAMHHFNPGWNTPLFVRRGIENVMLRDTGPASRAIRGGPVTESRVFDVFDDVTYNKGGSVLSMVEQWVGEPAFRRGLRAYMAERRMQAATAGDLWHHIGRAARRDVGAMAGRWTNQTGLPLVGVTTRCEARRLHVSLSQQRFSELAQPHQLWPIPVQLARGESVRTVMLDGPSSTLVWGACDGPPLRANAGAEGYYRVAYSNEAASALAAAFATLPRADQLTLLNDSFALARAAHQDLSAYLPWLAALPPPQDPTAALVWMAALDQIVTLRHVFAGAEPDPALRRVHLELMLQALEPMGWDGAADEAAETQDLRSRLLTDLSRLGHGPTREEAERRFDAALDLKGPMSASLRRAVLAAASPAADAMRIARLTEAMRTAESESERSTLFQGLIGIEDPALIDQMLDDAIAGRLPRTQAAQLPTALSWSGQRGEQVQAHLLRHWPAWKALVGESAFGSLQWQLPSTAWFSVDPTMPQRLTEAQRQHLGHSGDAALARATTGIDAQLRWRAREQDTLGPALQAWQRPGR